MRYSKAPALASFLFALVVGLTPIKLAIIFTGPNAPDSTAMLTKTLLESVIPLVFGMVGALIVARQPRNTIGWLLMLIALGWAAGDIPTSYLPYALATSSEPSVATLVLLWFVGWGWWLLIGPLLLILVLFPTGRLPSPRWRWVIIAIATLFGIFLLGVTFSETLQAPESNVRFPNPIGIIPERVFMDFISVPWTVMLLTTASMCVAAVVVRFRHAATKERAQIKWFLYACAVFLSMYVVTGWLVNTTTGTTAHAWGVILFDLALLTIPSSIGIAILRHRLYDIDIIIRRTLIYGALTAMLAAIYVGSVVVLQRLVQTLSGGAQSEIVTVISTLTIVALFQPLRLRIQTITDRRFFRRKYDAARTLDAFSGRLRNETDLQMLTSDMVNVVEETLQPAHVSLWLRDSQGDG